MNLADVAPAPAYSTGQLWTLACAALACLFLTSTVILVIVLVRRNRKASGGGSA